MQDLLLSIIFDLKADVFRRQNKMYVNAHEFKVEIVISTVFEPVINLHFRHFILFR